MFDVLWKNSQLDDLSYCKANYFRGFVYFTLHIIAASLSLGKNYLAAGLPFLSFR